MAQTVGELMADLDADGTGEVVRVYEASTGITLTVATGADPQLNPATALSVEGQYVALKARDVNADGGLELLVETKGPGEAVYRLVIVLWRHGQAVVLSPAGGPCSGDQGFRSRWYAPWLADLDGDTWEEVVVWSSSRNQGLVEAAVYRWKDGTYTNTHQYIIPPLPLPTRIQ